VISNCHYHVRGKTVIQILKLELHKYPQGFVWSEDASRWTEGKIETLHPVSDPYYSTDGLEDVEFVSCPDDLWSQYIQCTKGRWDSVKQNNLIEFANKYGFSHYIILHEDMTNLKDLTRENLCPPTLENILQDIENLKQAHKDYLRIGTFSDFALKLLNNSGINLHASFTREGYAMQSSSTHSNIWLTWYQSVLKGNAKLCSVCSSPFYTRRKNADVCSGTCRNLKSKRSK
jgi:hypothetical protein